MQVFYLNLRSCSPITPLHISHSLPVPFFWSCSPQGHISLLLKGDLPRWGSCSLPPPGGKGPSKNGAGPPPRCLPPPSHPTPGLRERLPRQSGLRGLPAWRSADVLLLPRPRSPRPPPGPDPSRQSPSRERARQSREPWQRYRGSSCSQDPGALGPLLRPRSPQGRPSCRDIRRVGVGVGAPDPCAPTRRHHLRPAPSREQPLSSASRPRWPLQPS